MWQPSPSSRTTSRARSPTTRSSSSTSGPPGADPAGRSRPLFEKVSADNPDIVFGKVDTEAERELAAAFQISSIPTLVVIRDRTVLLAQPGALPEAALADVVRQVWAVDMEQVRAGASA